MYDLSLLVLTKNEENKIERMLRSAISLVKEIIVIDTGSTDRTKEIIKEVAPNAKVFYEPFTTFDNLLNKGIKHCTCKWILTLDADEELLTAEYYLFAELLDQNIYDCWKIPRHHWLDLTMEKEYKAKHWYPNYSPKLFLNNNKIKFKNYVSPGFIGHKKIGFVKNGLHIQHFNLVYDTKKQHDEKQAFYDKLIQAEQQKKNVLPYDLTTLTLVHDEAISYIPHMLRSIVGLAKEYVFIDNGEKHLCSKVIKKIIPTAKVYKEKFTNFGDLCNKGIKHCTSKWILSLDTDEWLDPNEKDLFVPLLKQTKYDMFCIPRKHYRNLERNGANGGWYAKAFPDYQARLFLNNKKIKYTGKVHCGRVGMENVYHLKNGLHLYHFSFVFRDFKDTVKTDKLYKKLRAEGKREAIKRLEAKNKGKK